MNKIEKVKICIVSNTIPPAFGGGGLRAYRYSKRLEEKNMLGFILTRDIPGFVKTYSDSTSKKDVSPDKIIRVHKALYRGDSKIGLLRCLWSEYIKLPICVLFLLFRKRGAFDVIHCFGTSGSMLQTYAIVAGKILKKKTVLGMTLLGNDDPLSVLNKDPYKIKRKFKFWAYSKADIFISISGALTEAYKSSKLEPSKLREIQNPVDTRLFSPSGMEEKNSLREKLGIPKGNPVFLFTGAIIERKRIDLLLESFVLIKKYCPNAILLLVGPISLEPEFFNEMNSYAETSDIAENVVFTNLVDNVHEYMKASDIFMFASDREGLPNAILEAMASGLPVISSNIPGTIENVIDNGSDGIIVDSKNAGDLASAAIMLLKDVPLQRSVSERASRKIQEMYSTEIIDQKYHQLYYD